MSTTQERRSRILEAASRLLRHYGPHKTTVSDVAREAGVGVGTVYLEFPSKDAIVEALSRDRHAAVLEAMRAAASKEGPASERLAGALTARLDALFRIANEGAHACDLVHCVVGRDRGSPPGPPASVPPPVVAAQGAFQRDELALIEEVLRQGALAGELDVPDAEAAACTIVRAYVTFTLPWIRERDAAEAHTSIEAMHRLVLHGLLRRGGRARR